MAVDIDQLFGGMATAPIMGSGTYLEEGLYTIKTKQLFVNDGHKGKSFICEFEIVTSTNEANPVGSTASYVVKMDSSNKYAFGNVTKLVMALIGYECTRENEQSPKIRGEVELIARAACGSEVAVKELGANYEAGMLIGITLKVEATKVATLPKNGKPAGVFTQHKWAPLSAA